MGYPRSGFNSNRLSLCDLLAASPAFRGVVALARGLDVSQVDSSLASQHIYSPFASDRLDGLGRPLAARPRAIINRDVGFTLTRDGTRFKRSQQPLVLVLEFPPHPESRLGESEHDINLGLGWFEGQVGLIIADLETRSGTDKLTGEAVQSLASLSHANIEEIAETIPCCECDLKGNDELFYGVELRVSCK